MSKFVLLDTGPLGKYTNPQATPSNEECRRRVNALLVAGTEVRVPRIAVYECRRKLAHLQLSTPVARRLERFDVAVATLGLIPMSDDAMSKAADLWAECRHRGITTAPKEALDGDVILVAQAIVMQDEGHEVKIATSNWSDLDRIFPHHVLNWDDLSSMKA